MKLTQKQQEFLATILSTCHSIGISSVIIEPELIRGASEDRKTLLLTEVTDPALIMPTTMGITDISSLSARMQLIDGVMDVTIVPHADQQRAVTINMKSGKLSVGFRCSMPSLIKAPSKFTDMTDKLTIAATDELTSVISRGVKALGADTFSIRYDAAKDVVSVIIIDINDEKVVVQLDCKPSDEVTEDFEHMYSKEVVSILQKVTGGITISDRGMLYAKINDLTIALVPMVRY